LVCADEFPAGRTGKAYLVLQAAAADDVGAVGRVKGLCVVELVFYSLQFQLVEHLLRVCKSVSMSVWCVCVCVCVCMPLCVCVCMCVCTRATQGQTMGNIGRHRYDQHRQAKIRQHSVTPPHADTRRHTHVASRSMQVRKHANAHSSMQTPIHQHIWAHALCRRHRRAVERGCHCHTPTACRRQGPS
jgi:hypothetical protein